LYWHSSICTMILMGFCFENNVSAPLRNWRYSRSPPCFLECWAYSGRWRGIRQQLGQ